MDYPRYFSCTGVQFRKVVNHIFVIAGTGMAMSVPVGGGNLVYQPLLNEGLNRLNGGIPGYPASDRNGFVAGPAHISLPQARYQIAVNSELNRCQPKLKYPVRYPVIS